MAYSLVNVRQTVHDAIRQFVGGAYHGLLTFQAFQYVVYLIHILILSGVFELFGGLHTDCSLSVGHQVPLSLVLLLTKALRVGRA